MRAVDTNVLVRLATRDDAAQTAAAEAFVGAHGAWVSHIVLAEFVWVLVSVYRFGHEGIATALEILLAHSSLTLQDPDVVTSALADFRRRPSVSFSDCLILQVARKAGHLPLGTFDRELGGLPGAHAL